MWSALKESRFSYVHFVMIFLTAFLIRSAVFYLYVQHEERYCQADSPDYHFSALGIARGSGMHRVDNMKPIFWRTPGYPLFLSIFYNWYGLKSPLFSENSAAQKTALWVQIFLSSFTPLLVLILAWILFSSMWLAYCAAWIFVIHPGFVLASCFLLTEALAILFFFGFLICFFTSVKRIAVDSSAQWWVFCIIAAGILLGLYTWLRPNGEFVVVMSSILLLIGAASWRRKALQIILLILTFYATIGAWYVRNYQLTGKPFFCPMFGPYLVTFSAPKIIRRVANQPLDMCLKYAFYQAQLALEQQQEFYAAINSPRVISRELCCFDIAWPWISKYPHYFVYDWAKEVCKTAFDLYGSQMVALAHNCFKWDPVEEFLGEKLALCLYRDSLPLSMRIINWLELILNILIWIGLICGSIIFVVRPLVTRNRFSIHTREFTETWLKGMLLIAGIIGMTGGFGYARLRMPIEPLMVILALSFYAWLFATRKNRHQ